MKWRTPNRLISTIIGTYGGQDFQLGCGSLRRFADFSAKLMVPRNSSFRMPTTRTGVPPARRDAEKGLNRGSEQDHTVLIPGSPAAIGGAT
jgi:hypothetical protein